VVLSRAAEAETFSDEHLDAAAELLAERHRRHRQAEPLLPARFEDPAEARTEVEKAWRRAGASGAALVEDGRLAGYLFGAPNDELLRWGGPNVWVEHAGHAVTEPELARDLYALAAERWVEQGLTRHYVLVPAADRPLLEAWYRLGFGQQHAAGVREVPDEPWPDGVREAREDDLDAVMELSPLIQEHHARAPVFSANRRPDDPAAIRASIAADLASDEIGTLVAEVDGRIVGGFVVAPAEVAGDDVDAFGALGLPEGAASYLAWAGTIPEARGSGSGLALTQAAFAWAGRRGYESMVIDWRVTNLLSSRFWPARGFRTTFLRLYRSIP
jgi:GNAT superfamily N-acetyltransferase